MPCPQRWAEACCLPPQTPDTPSPRTFAPPLSLPGTAPRALLTLMGRHLTLKSHAYRTGQSALCGRSCCATCFLLYDTPSPSFLLKPPGPWERLGGSWSDRMAQGSRARCHHPQRPGGRGPGSEGAGGVGGHWPRCLGCAAGLAWRGPAGPRASSWRGCGLTSHVTALPSASGLRFLPCPTSGLTSGVASPRDWPAVQDGDPEAQGHAAKERGTAGSRTRGGLSWAAWQPWARVWLPGSRGCRPAPCVRLAAPQAYISGVDCGWGSLSEECGSL